MSISADICIYRHIHTYVWAVREGRRSTMPFESRNLKMQKLSFIHGTNNCNGMALGAVTTEQRFSCRAPLTNTFKGPSNLIPLNLPHISKTRSKIWMPASQQRCVGVPYRWGQFRAQGHSGTSRATG